MALLELDNVSIAYGQRDAVKGISLQVAEGGNTTLLGGNGAGKTTTLRAISGLKPARAGSIRFNGKDITRLPAHAIVALGIAHCPEGRRVFPTLTVEENLTLGGFVNRARPAEVKRAREEAYDLFPRLLERRNQLAGTLSGGEQQMLAIGRALMGEPSLLLLDEPSSGLAPSVVAQVMELVEQLSVSGLTIMLIEQDVDLALRVCNRVLVMRHGRVAFDGPKEQLGPDPRGAISQLFAGLPVTTTEAS